MKGKGIYKGTHDHSKHGLLNLRTRCEVRKRDLVEFIMVAT